MTMPAPPTPARSDDATAAVPARGRGGSLPSTDVERVEERDWGLELAYLNRRRLVWLSAALGVNVLFALTGAGRTSVAILVGYGVWLAGVAAGDLIRRRLVGIEAVVRLATVAFLWDLTLLTVQLFATGGGWWLGATFHGLFLAIIAATMPVASRRRMLVAVVGAYAALLTVQAAGWYVPESWFGLPDLRELPLVYATLLGLGLVALLAFWNLILFQGTRIERQQERWRQMVVSSPYATLILDAEGRPLEFTGRSTRYLGLPLSARRGAGFVEAVPVAQRDAVLAAVRQAVAGTPARVEHALVGDDGVERWFGVSYAPIDTVDGRPAVLAQARDVTAERAALLEREALEQRLAESRRMQAVGRLVSGVAHELNNPLAAVLGLAEQLHDEAHDPALRHDLGVVRTQAGRARAIVRDLLRVARSGSERERTVVSLGALAREAAAVTADAFGRDGVRLVVDVADGLPPLKADATGLVQVLTNLLSNARSASARGGTVQLLVRADTDGWSAVVEDDGAGIPPDVLPHLFEPFFTTRRPGEGTGLGLAVSRGIVEDHGGTLRAENRGDGSGRGARFEVRLPATLAADAPVAAVPAADVPAADVPAADVPAADVPAADGTLPSPAVEAPPGRADTVLIIDDEPAIRAALARWFARRGVRVAECADGAEAIARLAREADGPGYLAIICDLKMPEVGGAEVYRWIAAHRPALLERFLIATGDVASPDVAAFLAEVPVPVLEKPFELGTLATHLDDLGVRLGTPATAAPPAGAGSG